MKVISTNFAILEANNTLDTNNMFNIGLNDVDSKQLVLNANETINLLSGSVILSHDATTGYSITAQVNNTYRLNFASGADPIFRTSRVHSGDNTTVFSITKVGNTMVLTNTAGTIPNFLTGGFIPGDLLEITSSISNLNQGVFTVLLAKENELVLDNANVLAENFTLVNNSDLNGYSQAGVQVGNTLTISGNVFQTNNSFEITKVTNKYLEFTSILHLPNEGPYTNVNNDINISNKSAKFVSIIASQECSVTIDGVVYKIRNLIDQTGLSYDGQLFLTGLFTSISLNNTSINLNNIRLVIAG